MIEDYLTLDVEVRRAAPLDKWGEPEAGGGSEVVAAHYRSGRRLVTSQTGEEIVATGPFVFAPGFAVSVDDRIVAFGREHRPVLVERPRSLDGEESVRVWVV